MLAGRDEIIQGPLRWALASNGEVNRARKTRKPSSVLPRGSRGEECERRILSDVVRPEDELHCRSGDATDSEDKGPNYCRRRDVTRPGRIAARKRNKMLGSQSPESGMWEGYLR